MDRIKIKFLAAEILFMLVCALEACVAFAAQLLERTVVSTSYSFMFPSIAYEYNALLYALGWVLYVLFVFVALWFFKLKVTAPHAPGRIYKLISVVIAVLLAILTGIGLSVVAFFYLGFGGYMRPEFLMYLSVAGMPAIALAGMVYNVFRGDNA
jgi:hypothetical protein